MLHFPNSRHGAVREKVRKNFTHALIAFSSTKREEAIYLSIRPCSTHHFTTKFHHLPLKFDIAFRFYIVDPCNANHKGINCTMTFCAGGTACQGASPKSAHNGVRDALVTNGQSACETIH